MLFLNGQDIEDAVSKPELINQMEEGMRLFESNGIAMPPRSHLTHGSNTLLLMPCFGDHYFCTKLVSVFPGNQKKGLPVVNGMVLLNDADTGKPVAILDGQALTGLRTGAVGAVGVRHLTPKTPLVLGLVGCGVQGFHQVRFAAATRQIEAVYLYNRDEKKIPAFMEKLAQDPGLNGVPLKQAKESEALLAQADTVILATSSETPVLPDNPALFKGRTLIGIGSYRPDMQEFPKAAFVHAHRMLLDTPHARHESGDVITPLEKGWINEANVQSMGGYLLDQKRAMAQEGEGDIENDQADGSPDRMPRIERRADETILYKSVGMAVFDLMAAVQIYTHAKEKGLGQTLSI